MKNMPIFDYINTKSLRVIGFLIITSVFCYGQSVLKQDNKYGIQDEAGNIIVPVEYEYISKHKNLFFATDHLQRKGVFDGTGKEIIKFDKYDLLEIASGNKCIKAEKDGKCGYFDKQGNLIIPIKFDYCYAITNRAIEVKLGDAEGWYDFEGKSLVPISMGYTNAGLYRPNSRYIIIGRGIYKGIYDINKQKEILAADKYIEIDFDKYLNQYIVTNIDTIKGFVDTLGQEILKPTYDEIKRFNKKGKYCAVKQNGLIGVIDRTGHEIITPKYSDIKYNEDTLAIGEYFEVYQHSLKGIIASNGICLVPPKFTKINIHHAKSTSGNFVWIETSKNKFTGVYDLKCNEIIPANQYAKISFLYNPIPHFIVQDHTGKQGIVDINGQPLFTIAEYDQVSIQISDQSSTGYMVFASEKKNKRVVTYELYTNKFVNDSKEVELYMHIKNGDTYFEQKLYTKAANSYTKALAIKQLDYVIFNRGLARYNSTQYKMAMNDFDKYIVLGKNQEDVERARELRQHAQKLQTQKVNTALGVVAALFGIAAQAVAVATTPQYNTSNYIPTYTNNYTTTTCGQNNQNLGYLLDPTYAMDQVQQQYWNEYLQYTNGGQTMSYQEFMNIRASVYMENANTTNDSYRDHSNDRDNAPSNVDVKTNKTTDMCLDCCGSGHCSQCRGTGFRTDNMFGLGQDPSKECGICRGTGDCQKCGGVGRK